MTPVDASTKYAGTELGLFAHALRWKTYYARVLGPFIRGDVAEVGAGMGRTTGPLRGQARDITSWTCLEPDPALAELIREGSAAGRLSPVRVVADTLGSLPDDERFDTIVYIDVIEHIEDDRAELREAARRLRPGGHLVVLVPAHPFLFSPFDQAVGHHRRYGRARLVDAAPPGLTPVRLRALDSIGLFASLANRVLMRQSSPTAAQVALWDGVMVPLSRVVDPLTFWRVGKSYVGVWRRDA